MQHLPEALAEQIGAGFLAAYAAGAEHGDASVFFRIEIFAREFHEVAEVFGMRVDGAGEGAPCDLERIAGVDQQEIGRASCRERVYLAV